MLQDRTACPIQGPYTPPMVQLDSAPEPKPLAVTHDAYLAARAHAEPADLALDRYESFHRAGLDPDGLVPAPTRIETTTSDEGPVRKFLLPVPPRPGARRDVGPLEVESVIIPMRSRHETTHTLCVSSQVGCAMGCTFCETAQMGLVRPLHPAEIVAQWWAARHHLGQFIRNIVFMGMGEPLDQVETTIEAIRILTDHHGPAIPMKRITVSTVGRLDGMAHLREQFLKPGWRKLNLAISINAPNDEIRSQLMPVNRSMPMDDLIAMLETWPFRKNGKFCCEYVLIPGVNDADAHADELAHRLRNIPCCVNVIPYNPRRDSPWPAPHEDDVWRFLSRLEANGQFCKRRRTKGRDTMAACGQLGAAHIRNRRVIPRVASLTSSALTSRTANQS